MKRRGIELPDSNLWHEVAKSITPLAKKRGKSKKPTEFVLSARATTFSTPGPGILSPPPAAPRPTRSIPPPLADFDRRTSQKMLRGQADIDARIDLHGLGLEMARIHLLDFLSNRRARGSRLVLVITGKGASPFSGHTLHGHSQFDAPEREGKLRRALPRWLEEASFRSHVIGFQPAHPRHGGGGAFYVKLRKWQG